MITLSGGPSNPRTALAPTLTSDRLILREPKITDLETMAEIFAHPDHARFVGGKPSTREEVFARLLRYIGHWHVYGFGNFAIEARASGTLIGFVGPNDFQRDIVHGQTHLPEFGWGLSPASWGKGYAAEALGLALSWCDQTLKDEAVFCIIDPDNLSSHRLAQKLGFIEVERTTYHDKPTVIRRRPLRKG